MAGNNACHGSGPTGQSDSAAALPDTHPQMSTVKDLHKFAVDAIRKAGGMLEQDANLLQRYLLTVGHQIHGMGAADIHGGKFPLAPGYCDFFRLRGFQHRHAHVHPDFGGLVVFGGDLQRLDTVQRLHRDFRLDGPPVVIHIFADAADTVAAHPPLGAVGVEHPHTAVGFCRRLD